MATYTFKNGVTISNIIGINKLPMVEITNVEGDKRFISCYRDTQFKVSLTKSTECTAGETFALSSLKQMIESVGEDAKNILVSLTMASMYQFFRTTYSEGFDSIPIGTGIMPGNNVWKQFIDETYDYILSK